jgi:lipoprotein signal peptidase
MANSTHLSPVQPAQPARFRQFPRADKSTQAQRPAFSAIFARPAALVANGRTRYTGAARRARGAFLDGRAGHVYREVVPLREKGMPKRSYRWLIFTLATVGFVADQASKYGMFNGLYQEGQLVSQREVIPGAFRFRVQYDPITPPNCDCAFVKWNGPVPPAVNHGALFSLGGQFKADANRFFAIVSVIAAVGISIWGLRKSTGQERWLCVALGLILGGTVGNLFDRVVFGGVRDFLYYYYLIDWPVFNVADCCLVVGAGLLLVQAIFGKKHEPAVTTTATSVENPPAMT